MFQLRLAWDRPARPSTGLTRHVLRVGLSTAQTGRTLPGNLCLVLDCSGSMATPSGAGTKLDDAIAACRAAVDCLLPDDLLTLITYNSRPTVRFAQRRRSDLAPSDLERILSEIRAQSVTCTDAALAAAEQQLRPHLSSDRSSTVLLVTDGHPTTRDGQNLDARACEPYYDAARRLSDAGIQLVAVGLGSARHYNGPFLTQLADAGRGRFCMAPDSRQLGELLRGLIGAAQHTVASQVELTLAGAVDELQLLEACQILPEYRPLAVSAGSGWSVSCGPHQPQRPGEEMVVLVRVEAPGSFGMETGPRPVLSVQAEWRAADGSQARTAPVDAVLNYTDDFAEQSAVDPQVEPLRLRWDLNRCQDEVLRSSNPQRTCQLLGVVARDAAQAGLPDVAAEAQGHIEQLRTSGQWDAERMLQMSQRLRTSARALVGPAEAEHDAPADAFAQDPWLAELQRPQ